MNPSNMGSLLADGEQVFLGLQVVARLAGHDARRVDAPEQQRGETTAVVADPSEGFHDPILSNGLFPIPRKPQADQGFCLRNRRSEKKLDGVGVT